jgi:hypothetical protein
VVRINLGGMTDAVAGFYHGTMTTDSGAGVVVRTHWASAGGATAHEAPEPSLDLVLPLLVKTVGTLGTELWIMNTVAEGLSPEKNLLEFSVHANETGEEILEFFQELEPGESGHEDTAFNPRFEQLPDRPGGGYIGALWLHGAEEIAAIQYLEDYGGAASAALRALPVADAATWQILPWVRAGELSGSLVGIASVADTPGNATISYLRAGTGREVARQTTPLAPRGAVYIDLGNRGLGSLTPPAALRSDFDGSVLIEADVPVLAAVFDHSAGAAVTGAGYNAFGPGDLSDSVAVTGIGVIGRPSELMIQNGEPRDVSVQVTFRGTGGETVGTTQSDVPRGARWTVVPSGLGDADYVSALIEATGGIAVLTRDWNIGPVADCAVSAGVPLSPDDVPTTPSSTATSWPTSATPTPTESSPTPTTGGTPSVTVTPTATGKMLGEYRVFLPKSVWETSGPLTVLAAGDQWEIKSLVTDGSRCGRESGRSRTRGRRGRRRSGDTLGGRWRAGCAWHGARRAGGAGNFGRCRVAWNRRGNEGVDRVQLARRGGKVVAARGGDLR